MPIVAREDCGPRSLLDEAWDILQPVACWLGQAGFLIRAGDVRLVIDPYLSDSLAEKYRGSRFPHVRRMPPPLGPEELLALDFVFCTHAHSDHMDPGTLGVLAGINPQCRFVLPRATVATAESRGVPPARMIAADAGENGPLVPGIRWRTLASAHEELKVDAAGNPLYLGYILELHGATVYHSGDCVPYPGLAADLRRQAVDVAILPVNGRDADRSAAGILGNFTFNEAIQLCREAEIGSMLACHFGMFDFNTVSERWLDERIVALVQPPQCVRPRIGTGYELWPSRPKLGEESTLYSQGITP